jgi:hypothetical protein
MTGAQHSCARAQQVGWRVMDELVGREWCGGWTIWVGGDGMVAGQFGWEGMVWWLGEAAEPRSVEPAMVAWAADRVPAMTESCAFDCRQIVLQQILLQGLVDGSAESGLVVQHIGSRCCNASLAQSRHAQSPFFEVVGGLVFCYHQLLVKPAHSHNGRRPPEVCWPG